MSSAANPIDAGRLVKALVETLASGNAIGMHFERMAQDLRVPEGAPTIMFLSGIKSILRDLPDKAFNEPKSRLSLVDAVQDALDAAIEAEEEALEPEQDEAPDDEPNALQARPAPAGRN